MNVFFLLFVQEEKPEAPVGMTEEDGPAPAPHPNSFGSNEAQE